MKLVLQYPFFAFVAAKVLNLMRSSELKRADAVASAIKDGLEFLTRDKGIFPRIPSAKKF